MHKQKLKALYSPSGTVSIVPEDINLRDNMTSGFYKIVSTNTGMGTTHEMCTDNSIEIPVSAINLAKTHIDLGYIRQYFSDVSKDIHGKLQIKQKLGYMLHGIQGTGKTTSCYAIAEELIKTDNAVVVTVTDISSYLMALDFLERCKKDLGDFMSITIYDECEEDMSSYSSHFKRRLDSSGSLNNHLSFFTTNHIRLIPEAIKERPSRIKFVTEITGIKDEAIIFEIVSQMNNPLDADVQLNPEELKSIIPGLVDSTLDEIKNEFIDTVFNIQFEKRIAAKSVAIQLAEQALES